MRTPAQQGPEGTAKPISQEFYSRRIGPWVLVSANTQSPLPSPFNNEREALEAAGQLRLFG